MKTDAMFAATTTTKKGPDLHRAAALRSPLILAMAAMLTLGGCAASDDDSVSLEDLAHVHSVATDGKDFFLASHHGLYVLLDDKWQLRGVEFDVMGLEIDNGVFYASGHPGELKGLPDPLGILSSDDQGKTWTPKVLTGEVDFHLLRVVDSTLVGVAANYGVVVSSIDDGDTWTNLPITDLTSLTLNPANSEEMLLSAAGELRLSIDDGQTFRPIPAPKNILHSDWTTTDLYLASASTLYRSPNYDREFVALETEFDEIVSVAAHLDAVIVLDENGVHISRDGGDSFSLVP